ncbi:MAG: hypothetical protein HQL09_03845 [Nitrospirae bacterium]|nr:hypothetical protein [Nitrospirota bacterium]
MGKKIRSLLYMMIMAGGVVVLLTAVNRLPSSIQKGFARQYDSVEEAKRSLGFDNIFVPRYFPEGISWPPSFIFGQKEPYRAVVLEFREAKAGGTVLIVIQTSRRGSESQLQRTRLSELKEDTPYRLKGRIARLQVGTCDKGIPCSRISWQDRDLYFTVLFMSSPFELIRIAESMIQ